MRRPAVLILLCGVLLAGCRAVGGPVTRTVGGTIWGAKGDGFSVMRPVRKAAISAAVLPWTMKADRAIRRAERR